MAASITYFLNSLSNNQKQVLKSVSTRKSYFNPITPSVRKMVEITLKNLAGNVTRILLQG